MLRSFGRGLKLDPTTPNMSQHITIRWPNAHNMLRPTILRYVAFACCDPWPGLKFTPTQNKLRRNSICDNASFAAPSRLQKHMYTDEKITEILSRRYIHISSSVSIRVCFIKPRPNDRNMSTQHIATLLGAACCVRLATMLRCVATCWVLLAQV